ncbi:hypothetical protein AQJ30_32480 [Streptomyces longwoodensis]|uniref:Uncharacterized protein n=1 Tax=Streptomyces longwoodensis TaxID=68231 RepID=A0A101QPM3_9ACTN|nr:hypothetical protein [Streptomyces longwoodensis]KUN33632.1 hypothetical protein AQJ30_32480 [Streptomyces longwoodensis]
MARDYDSQLLESVAVRRRRMRDALLFGTQRGRRTLDERLGKVFAGIAIAAVLCAGCVGWSFLQATLAKQKAEQDKQRQQQEQLYNPSGSSPSGTPSGGPSGSASGASGEKR